METAESHCDAKRAEFKTCTFSWSIQEFSIICRNKEVLKSTAFSAAGDDFKWHLEYSYIRYEKVGRASFYLLSDSDDDLKKYSPVSGHVEISVMKPDLNKMKTRTSSFKLEINTDKMCRRRCNFIAFCPLRDIERCCLTQDRTTLTISCKMIYYKQTDITRTSTVSDPHMFEIFETRLSRDLEQLLNNGRFSDLTIVVKGKKYPVHKAILSTRCSAFYSMLEESGIPLENVENHIDIADIEPEVFEEMLYYTYTAKMKNSEESVFKLLPVADKYGLKELRIACGDVLIQKLSTDNADKMLNCAETHNFEVLKTRALRFMELATQQADDQRENI